MKIKSKNFVFILALFMVLLCCFSAVSASEIAADDVAAVADDVTVDEVVSEVDSADDSIAVENDEGLGFVDDSVSESLAVQDEEQVNDVEEVDSTLTENEKGQTHTFESVDEFWQWYSYASINQNFDTIYLKEAYGQWGDSYGVYDLSDPNFLSSNIQFTIIGLDDNVLFNMEATDPEVGEDGEEYYPKLDYDLDSGSISKNMPAENGEGTVSSASYTITHNNIIFDCPVKVGSKNFKFINCTFKRSVEVTDKGNTGANIVVSFIDCKFDFDPTEIKAVSTATLKFGEDPIALDSVVDISSSEKGVVVIALTDNSSVPIAGATVKYTVNGGDEQTNTTGEDGKFTISGLTGEVTIAVTYDGNESFNPISGSQFFNFTEEPAANDTNGSNDTPVAPTKVATKLTAPKVSATYNVAKKLVITLKDANGKVLANKKVTVKVGTISKTLTTNAKGQVSLNVATLVPKTYTATVKFAGDDGYLASSVSPKVVVSKAKPKITAKAKTFKVKVKTKKYTVTLKNNKGKVMKKVKLTLKVGKKTYKATTNSKGKATFKITKLTKKGKYTATVKFAGSKYYKATSKKVKITVKK